MKYSSPAGTRDIFSSEGKLLWETIKKCMKTPELYGYEPVYTPAFEKLEVLNIKSSDEISNSIYYVVDPTTISSLIDGESTSLSKFKYGLRFDKTIGASRLVAEKERAFIRPIKFCYYGRNWRYEDTKSQRFNEYTGVGVEYFGAESSHVDSEVITCFIMSFQNAGLQQFTVRVGDRILIDLILDSLNVDESSDLRTLYFRTLDRLLKEDEEGLLSYFQENFRQIQESVPLLHSFSHYNTTLVSLLNLLILSGDNKERFSQLKLNFTDKKVLERIQVLEQIFSSMGEVGIADNLLFDPGVTRGLDYYTGIVFEAFSPYVADGELAIGGGGRYDSLVKQLGGTHIKSIGYELGIDRIVSAILKQDKEITYTLKHLTLPNPQLHQRAFFSILAISKKFDEKCNTLAHSIRQLYLPVETYPGKTRVGDTIKKSVARNCPFFGIIGQLESEHAGITLKNLGRVSFHREFFITESFLLSTIRNLHPCLPISSNSISHASFLYLSLHICSMFYSQYIGLDTEIISKIATSNKENLMTTYTRKKEEFNDDHPQVLNSLRKLARLSFSEGDFSNALLYFKEYFSSKQNTITEDVCYMKMGECLSLLKLGKYNESRDAFISYKDMLLTLTPHPYNSPKMYSTYSCDLLEVELYLVYLAIKQQEFTDGMTSCDILLKTSKKIFGDTHPFTLLIKTQMIALIHLLNLTKDSAIKEYISQVQTYLPKYLNDNNLWYESSSFPSPLSKRDFYDFLHIPLEIYLD